MPLKTMHSSKKVDYKIHWNSRIARVFLKKQYAAVTIGKHIFIKHPEEYFSVTRKNALIAHEKCHVKQYAEMGFCRFVFRYIVFHLLYGHKDNPLEKSCRV